MADYESHTYGNKIADIYDRMPYVAARPTDATVEFLVSIAGKRRVLELGIGTGRIAIPLAAKGFKVSGLDASEKMVEQMRAKPGGDGIPVVMGNFADVKIGGKFSLIYVVFNTFFSLPTQDEQLRCFQRVAKHLTDDGVFVIEGFVPDLGRYDRGQRVGAIDMTAERVLFEVTQHDVSEQYIRSVQVDIREGEAPRLYTVQLRYAAAAEFDLMARLAGMRLRARYGGWNREPFNLTSQSHVSLYELAPKPPAVPAPRKLSGKRPARRRRT
jgi:SAM-dependent methyltransferase